MDRKTLSDYMSVSRRTYKFLVKLVVEPTDEMLDKIETVLDKYNLLSFDKVTKIMHHPTPVDFPWLVGGSVWIYEAEVEYPVASSFLENEMRNKVKLSDPRCIVVRSDSENEVVENSLKPEDVDSVEPVEKDVVQDAMDEHKRVKEERTRELKEKYKDFDYNIYFEVPVLRTRDYKEI